MNPLPLRILLLNLEYIRNRLNNVSNISNEQIDDLMFEVNFIINQLERRLTVHTLMLARIDENHRNASFRINQLVSRQELNSNYRFILVNGQYVMENIEIVQTNII